MTIIVGISGSLRRESYNSALLRAAAAMMPAGGRLDIHSIQPIPLYNGDDEAATGIPLAVAALKDAIAAADGLLIATPEYNNSIPGVAKNAIDWLTRPTSDIQRVFAGKPVALVGATTGGFGTALAQNAWIPILHKLGARIWSGGRLMVSGADKAFDAEGNMIDDAVRSALRTFLEGFAGQLQGR
ncbi:MAG: NADPH-dependent FMN reductase [Dokdonella sp.]|uniref:NADPH-dependent FMN reductase n=1 Tax=Dokdonella sp. TaxID=2291710 RepID=UPI0032666D15